ncbi:MAG: NADH-quinone oxidoreductase subunit C [Lachnospiraceae bacterium]|nr:NADH-quinone oxidoreductase subunit C [Lachnospiraceae bacterium]
MSKIYDPVQTYRNVEPENLIEEVKMKREQGKRLLQMFASYIDKKFEVIYCFDEGEYKTEHLRVVADRHTVIPSVGEYYPYATSYENEACELFGVKINVADDGYKHKLYKIEAETPYVSPYDDEDEE